MNRTRRILGLALMLACAGAASAAEPTVTLYRGATLVEVATGTERPGMAILVRGERIERVAPVADLPAPTGATIVDAAGLFVSPGLVNSHEHLATPPRRAWAEAQMRRDLYGGITAVRDMADDLRQVADLARAARVGETPGPDIYYAALMAGPQFFEDPRTHAVTAGAVAGQTPWMRAVTAETDLRQAVAEAKGTGATAIKIYADLPARLVAAITTESHRQGLKVWAHAAVFPASPSEVLAAGADAVSHVCMLAYQASETMPPAYHRRAAVDEAKFPPGTDNAVVASLLARMRSHGQVLDATLWVYAEMARGAASHPGGPRPYCSEPLAERLTGQAARAGVILSTGTDGFAPTASPWPALQDEMELMQDKAGLAPLAVLRAATLGGAAAAGQSADFGEIAPGKLANLVFTTGDPAKDVRAFRTITLTVKRGAAFWRCDYRPITAAETGPDDDE